MMERLRGKVAVVTGASEGIGEAIVRQLAAHGMKVAALARRGEMLKKLENDLKQKGYGIKTYICDVSKDAEVKSAFQKIQQELGAITVLVNNAAVLKLVSLTDIDAEAAESVLNINVMGVLNCMREGLSSMKKHSIANGHIVNINSVAGHRDYSGFPGIAVYASSKHALTYLNNSLRQELLQQKSKIRISSISPGLVKTNMPADFIKENPEHPHLSVTDVVDAVVYAIAAPPSVNVSEIIIDPI